MGLHVNALVFESEHMVRVTEIDGEPWFVGRDVCRALGIQNESQALARLDEDERATHLMGTPTAKGVANTDPLSNRQEMIVISEPGVYRLVFSSRKPIAERFKRWLAHEVIPAIRMTGSYRPHLDAPDAEIIPPSPVSREFPHWPIDEMRAKKGVVDMYRHLYGMAAGRWISPQLGFPVPPDGTVDRDRQLRFLDLPVEGHQPS